MKYTISGGILGGTIAGFNCQLPIDSSNDFLFLIIISIPFVVLGMIFDSFEKNT